MPGRGRTCREVHAGALRVDLNRMNNERAALSIATAWIEALTVKLEAGG